MAGILLSVVRGPSSVLCVPSSSYFVGFFFCFASASRSVFFRRLARFLKLSLPLLCPISFNPRLHVAP
jgi:hypothetical protein